MGLRCTICITGCPDRRAAFLASFISNTRRAMDVAFAVIASFRLPIVVVIKAIVIAVAMLNSMSCAKVIAGGRGCRNMTHRSSSIGGLPMALHVRKKGCSGLMKV